MNNMIDNLYCEDCRDVLFQVISDCDNPIIVSDPPFNIGYKYDKYKDKMNDDDYYTFMGKVFGMCPSVIDVLQMIQTLTSGLHILPDGDEIIEY